MESQNRIKDGWFSEYGTLWPGQCMSIEVDKVVYEGKSDYQDIIVFDSKTYGRVLVLDGVIQVTERDEFSYQEMMAHLPLCSHPNPKKVLVIGGGDGGILREICKHKELEEVTICEIDEKVIEVSKQYLPSTAIGYKDPRVKIHVGDGAAFMRDRKAEFDVIIVDSSDPVGPAETLFQASFYECMRDALKPDGIICTQGECMWLHLDLIKGLLDFSRKIYKHVQYAYTCIPTYPSGQIGFIIGSLGDACDKPKRKPELENIKYYNSDIHSASFVLPTFAKKLME